MTQHDGIVEMIETARERCKARLDQAEQAVSEEVRERARGVKKAALEYLEDVLSSADRRYEHFEESAGLLRRDEVPEFVELERYVLYDIKRSIEYAVEVLLEDFVRFYESLS